MKKIMLLIGLILVLSSFASAGTNFGLYQYLSFDYGDNCTDYSGYSRSCSYVGNVTNQTSGYLGGSVNVSGTGDYINLQSNLANQDFTIGFFYNKQNNNTGSVFGGLNNNSPYDRFYINQNSNGLLRINVGAGVSGVVDDIANSSSIDNWQFFTVTYKETTGHYTFYIDGVNVTQKANLDDQTTRSYLLGAYAYTDPIPANKQMAFDEFSLWNRELSNEEVATLYADYEDGLRPIDFSRTYLDFCENDLGYTLNQTVDNITFYLLNYTDAYVNLSMSLEYNGADLLKKNITLINSSINNILVCTYPSAVNYPFYIDYNLQYIYGSNIFNFYRNQSIIYQNTSLTTALFVSEGASTITATVFDNQNNRVEGAVVRIQEYDFVTGNYYEVGQVQTNFEGEAQMFLTKNTKYYRFLIYSPIDTLRKTTNPTYIYQDSIEFQINLFDDALEDYYTIKAVTTNLVFNNDTNNFRFTYSDSSGELSQSCLDVYRTTPSGSILLNSTCSNAASGTLLTGITPQNDTTYIAKAYGYLGGNILLFDTLSVIFFSENDIGDMGLIVLLVMTILFAFIIRASISLGIIMIPIPTLMLSAINMIPLNIYVAIGLEMAAIIIAIFINTRR